METAFELLFVVVPTLLGASLCLITGHFGVLRSAAPTLSTAMLMCGTFTYTKILMGWSTGLAGLVALGSGVLAAIIFIALYGVGFASKGVGRAK